MKDSMRPPHVSYWMWAHPSFADRELWHRCLVAARNMGGGFTAVTWGMKLYRKRGGKETVYVPRRQRKTAR